MSNFPQVLQSRPVYGLSCYTGPSVWSRPSWHVGAYAKLLASCRLPKLVPWCALRGELKHTKPPMDISDG